MLAMTDALQQGYAGYFSLGFNDEMHTNVVKPHNIFL